MTRDSRPTRFLTTGRAGAVEHVALNRPAVRNAFGPELIAELTAWAQATADAAGRHDVRVAVISGEGPVFSAGADAAWMASTLSYTQEENLRDAEAAAAMYTALDRLPVPLIGRVQGAAIGGGAGLAAVCDVVIADQDAIFGFTEVTLGIVPAVISPFVLAKIGQSAARALFLTGARFSATYAKEIGLVHQIVTAANLDAAVDDVVKQVLTGSPAAISVAKQLVRDVWGKGPDAAMPITTRTIAERRVSPEGQEGLKAFLEKRPPSWRP